VRIPTLNGALPFCAERDISRDPGGHNHQAVITLGSIGEPFLRA
jgi:hypothetical protein